jgi:P4 family phage/plasmid primase-like protien
MSNEPYTDYDVESPAHLADLLGRVRWFNWKLTDDRKIPRAPYANPDHHDKFVSWKEQEIWTDYETAAEWASKLPGYGVASCIPAYEDNTIDRIILFDFDNCRDPHTGAIHPEAWEFIDQYDLPAFVSTSGTGLHAFGWGSVPDGVKPSFSRALGEWGHTTAAGGDPELEVYGSARFVALTGEHIVETPLTAAELGEMGHDLYNRYGSEIKPAQEHDPSTPADAIDEMDATSSHDVIFDAIARTDPRDIRIRSTVTEERADGVKSLDPSWESSESGTRLAMFDDHFLYRKGNIRLDCLQLVALEERIISNPERYPSGRDFFDAVDALRDRGARIPKFVGTVDGGGDRPDVDSIDAREMSQSADTDASSEDADSPTTGESDTETYSVSWATVCEWFAAARDNDSDLTLGDARYKAAQALQERASFAADEQTDVLYMYDPDEGYFRDRGEPHIKRQLAERLGRHYSSRNASEVVDLIRSRNYRLQREFDGREWLLNVDNGILDVRTRELIDHNPEYLYRSKVPAEFDPDAEAPVFDKFINQVTPSGLDTKKIQEFAGYTLLHSQLPFHKALFLVGPQASGKSTFLDLIRDLIGREGVCSITPQELISERFAAVDLHGAMANIRNDIDDEMIKNVGKFKEIVSGDPIKVEEKRQPTFTIEPTAKHLYAANQLPDAAVDDDAFYRRILLVAFPTTIPKGERDPRLDEKLRAELPGVLNWALDGLDRLLENHHFTGDRAPAATRDTWESWGSSLGKFKDAAIKREAGGKVEKEKLYNAYLRFCRDRGVPAISGQQKFTQEFTSDPEIGQGRTTLGGKTVRVYTGLEVIWNRIPGGEDPDDDDDESAPSGLGDY